MPWLSDDVLRHLQAVADAPDLSGTRYELVGKLGQGGMAVVYLVRDRELDRPVALKVLQAGEPASQLAERMRSEARIIARLEHPGIVPVHDAGVLADGRVFYAMKWVRGQRLDEALAGQQSLADRLRLFDKICESVAFAHAAGVVHRDLKPANIMVGPFGEVLVMDWGVAKILPSAAPSKDLPAACAPLSGAGTQHGAVLGTPGYMAPEQARGDSEAVNERTDVFALGAVLQFLLTAAPFNPPGRVSRIPRALLAIVAKAMAEAPMDRYSSVAELTEDIRHFLANERVDAYPEGLLGPVWRFLVKYRVGVLLILTYLIMRIGLLLWSRP